jgi:hypothetical protein
VDEEGEALIEVGGEERYLVARAGDHLMTPFQCEVCNFRNIMGRNSNLHVVEDREIMEYIRRATLDAFWARETTTVKNNAGNARRIMHALDRLKMPSLLPPMGPFPLRDDTGMGSAVVVLDCSLDPGKHDTFIQFDTTRKTRPTLMNIHQASVGRLTDTIGSYERIRLWISSVTSHSFWFARFMTGFHKRVGDIKKQEKAITIDIPKACLDILEREWRRLKKDFVKNIARLLQTAEMGVWYVLACA